jgi:alpha/beta superfamily hydrolase
MLFDDKLNKPGEHPFVFNTQAGELEGLLTVPLTGGSPFVALLGHPHSLQGGTMNNKVVTTMARAFKELGIPSLRFNFRGVGHSQGRYDEGMGESEDMLTLCRLWAAEFPQSRYLFAGFSFGSYVAYRAAAQHAHELLITVAPPVHHYDYRAYQPPPAPWHLFQGDRDEVVPASLVFDFAAGFSPPLDVTVFAETSHFFHGKLLELKEKLIQVVTARGLRP